MKYYQDTETGQIYAYEDDFNPFESDIRTIPKTLTDRVKRKPTDTSVWYKENWIEKSDAPSDYIEPTSSIPSYNPTWMAHLRPYSAIISDRKKQINFSLEQINNNSYDGMELSEVVGTLPLNIEEGLDALISYDGAIAIPQCNAFPTRMDSIFKLNEILCSLLLGGVHVEVLHAHELMIGSLYKRKHLSAYSPSLHNQLRLNWASITERFQPLMYPRVLDLNDLKRAFIEGQQVINILPQFSPFFLINGYTSLINQNNNDALNNLWIVVEQLTEILWVKIYEKNSYSEKVRKRHSELQHNIDKDHIFAKHELLKLSEIINTKTYEILKRARKTRNDLAHEGISPKREVVYELWSVLSQLFEVVTTIENISMRKLRVGEEINWSIPPKINFEEWKEIVNTVK